MRAIQLLLLVPYLTFSGLVLSDVATAQMVITPAGSAQGLSLSTFVSGFTAGPAGITFPASGGVLMCSFDGLVRSTSSDADGQIATTMPSQNFGTKICDLVRDGNVVYMSEANGTVLQLNDNGTLNQTVISVPSGTYGMAVNPANGHIFLSDQGTNQILNIDPVAKTSTVFASASTPDGLSVSPDGTTLYVAAYGAGEILGFNTSSGSQVFNSGPISGGVDGTAAGAGLFANDLFVNLNSGSVIEINLTTLAQTVIADNGTRGDFAHVDTTNNTLLLTQSNEILRLTGGNFVPEPSSFALLGAGVIVFGAYALRRRHSVRRSGT